MVDLALQKIDTSSKGCWVDLGTGCGAIAVSLARSLPGWIGHAVDCSEDALALANRNLTKLVPKGKYFLHLGSWWEPLKPWWGKFDLVVSQYHDQALIPIKYNGIEDGVNITLGLDFIRTSPDHGTAFDIAGKGIASTKSFISAIKLAQRLSS